MTITAPNLFVPSYALDAWWTPAPGTPGVAVSDASTGEQLGSVSTEGLDVAGMVNHARTVGQRGLRACTLHE